MINMDADSLPEGKKCLQVSKEMDCDEVICKNEDEDERPVREVLRSPEWIELWPQVGVSIAVLTTAIQAGVGLAYSATLIPQLAEDPSIVNFNKTQASWIASLPAVSTPVGAFLVGPLMEIKGRKIAVIISSLTVLLSWIITFFTSHHLWTLYLARIIMGLGSGMGTAALVYVSEVACCWARPSLLCLNSVAVAGGILLSNGLGWIAWRLTALILAALALLSIILCFLIPESPHWLFTHRSPHLAKRALTWLNRPHWLLEEEWERLKKNVGGNTRGKDSGFWRQLQEREAWKPIALLLGIFTFQQLSGVYVIIFYAATLFQSVGGDFGGGLDHWGATLLLGVVRFILSIVAAILSTRMGRRSLMVWSGVGISISWFVCVVGLWVEGRGGTLYLHSSPSDFPLWLKWTSLVSLLSGVGFGALGMMVIPWALIGELLSPRIRGPASGLVVSFAYILLFGMTKTFPFLLDYVSLASVLLGYAIASGLTVLYILLYLPETFGKSFHEVAKSFQ